MVTARISNPAHFGCINTETATVARERHRRVVVKLIFAVYWLVVFEGVIRKWVAPQWGKPLFFLRDPLVLTIYLLVLTRHARAVRSIFLEVGCMLGVAGLILIGLQLLLSETQIPAFLMAYGWRNYFFYIPLTFVTAAYFEMPDLEAMARRTLYAALPMLMVMIAQVAAPPESPLNGGLGDNPEDKYLVMKTIGPIVRPSGTFTSSTGLQMYIASAVALMLSIWLTRVRPRPMGWLWLLVCTMAVIFCLGLAGSRGAIMYSGLIVISAVIGLTAAAPQMGFKVIAFALVVMCVGVTVVPLAFPNVTSAFVQRWVEAGADESKTFGNGGIFARAVDEVVRFRVLLTDRPIIGYGLGVAGNAAWYFGTRDEVIPFYNQQQIFAAEPDLGRNILDLGPIVGLCYIAFRVAFVVWLGIAAFVATLRSLNPMPWLLFSFVSVILSYGQITGHGTVNGYGWLFAGFCIAAIHRVGSMQRSRMLVPLQWGIRESR